jgi:hypothetical protein
VRGDDQTERRLDRWALVMVGSVALLVAAFIVFGESIAPDPKAGSIELWGREIMSLSRPIVAKLRYILASAAAAMAALVFLSFRSSSLSRRRTIVVFCLMVTLACTSLFFCSLKTAFSRKAYLDASDNYHYLLGTKYYAELGHTKLYECTAVAREEAGKRNPKLIRSLDTYQNLRRDLVVNETSIAGCHEAFGEARWKQFTRDVGEFEKWPRSKRWQRTFDDHGYNGTPIRTTLVSPITNRVVPSQRSMGLLGLGDLFLITLACLLVIRAFGWRMGLAFVGIYFTNFVDFSAMGGATFRYVGTSSVIISLCLLKLKRHIAAGLVLSLATGLLIFPVLFFGGVVLTVALQLVRKRRPESGHVRFLLAGAAGLVVLVCLTALGPRGFEAWPSFFHQMEMNAVRITHMRIGFRYHFIFPKDLLVDQPRLPRYEHRVAALGMGPEVLRYLLSGALILMVLRQRKVLDDVSFTALLGFTVFFVAFTTVRYYYAGLLGFPLMWHASLGRKRGAWFVASFLVLAVFGFLLEDWFKTSFLYNTLASSGYTVILIAAIIVLERQRPPQARLPAQLRALLGRRRRGGSRQVASVPVVPRPPQST